MNSKDGRLEESGIPLVERTVEKDEIVISRRRRHAWPTLGVAFLHYSNDSLTNPFPTEWTCLLRELDFSHLACHRGLGRFPPYSFCLHRSAPSDQYFVGCL